MQDHEQDYKQIMTSLRFHFKDPFNNAQALLSHHEDAGRIPLLESLSKKATRITREHFEVIHYTKWYLKKTQDKDVEIHIYMEGFVCTLTSLLQSFPLGIA